MIYLTYGEYKTMGGSLDATAFNRNIDYACALIDNATFNRVSKMAEVPNNVKVCCRDLIDYIAENSPSSRQVTSESESAGAVSQSVSYATSTVEDVKNNIQRMIVDYLYIVKDDNGTPLLYRGCME